MTKRELGAIQEGEAYGQTIKKMLDELPYGRIKYLLFISVPLPDDKTKAIRQLTSMNRDEMLTILKDAVRKLEAQ